MLSCHKIHMGFFRKPASNGWSACLNYVYVLPIAMTHLEKTTHSAIWLQKNENNFTYVKMGPKQSLCTKGSAFRAQNVIGIVVEQIGRWMDFVELNLHSISESICSCSLDNICSFASILSFSLISRIVHFHKILILQSDVWCRNAAQFLQHRLDLLTHHLIVGLLITNHPESLRRRSQSTRSFQD